MSDVLSRAVYDALLPGGSLWNIAPDSDLDDLFEGMGDNADAVAQFMLQLSLVRNPFLTPWLSDLEREYGIATDTRLTEEVRRQTLAAQMFFQGTAGTRTSLQTALQMAGFDVQIHENSPAVDPDLFLNNIFLMVAGGDNAYAGYIPAGGPPSTAVAGRTGGSLLVNGSEFSQRPDYISTAENMQASKFDTESFAGRYDDLIQEPVIYPISDDPNSWPFFFFVGGDATRDGTGALTAIEVVDIPIGQQTIFERIILRYKPIHTWAGLMVNYA